MMWPWSKPQKPSEDFIPVLTEVEVVYVLETTLPNGSRFLEVYHDADTCLTASAQHKAANNKVLTNILRCKVAKEPAASDFVKA